MRNWPPERMLSPKHKEEHTGSQRTHGHRQLCGVWHRSPCARPTKAVTLHLSPAAAHTARLHSAQAPLLTGCLLMLRLPPSDCKGSCVPKDPHSLHLCGVQGRMRTDRIQTVEAGTGKPEDTEYYKYPCPLVELQENSGCKRQVTGHANCHTEGLSAHYGGSSCVWSSIRHIT